MCTWIDPSIDDGFSRCRLVLEVALHQRRTSDADFDGPTNLQFFGRWSKRIFGYDSIKYRRSRVYKKATIKSHFSYKYSLSTHRSSRSWTLLYDEALCMYLCPLWNVTENKRLDLGPPICALIHIDKVSSYANFQRNCQHPWLSFQGQRFESSTLKNSYVNIAIRSSLIRHGGLYLSPRCQDGITQAYPTIGARGT